jgi:hypothetical protein
MRKLYVQKLVESKCRERQERSLKHPATSSEHLWASSNRAKVTNNDGLAVKRMANDSFVNALAFTPNDRAGAYNEHMLFFLARHGVKARGTRPTSSRLRVTRQAHILRCPTTPPASARHTIASSVAFYLQVKLPRSSGWRTRGASSRGLLQCSAVKGMSRPEEALWKGDKSRGAQS